MKKNAPKNSSRASDLGQILTTGTTGFVTRKRTGIGLFFHFFMLFCLVVLGAALLVWYESPQGCGLAVAIGLSLALISQNLEKLRRVKHSLEFMNALFSSALGRGYLFTFIVKSTGEIVFFNRPFQAAFPAYVDQESRMLDVLFELANIPAQDRESIKSRIATLSEGTVQTSMKSGENGSQSVTFYLEPIERPTGFTLVRGK